MPETSEDNSGRSGKSIWDKLFSRNKESLSPVQPDSEKVLGVFLSILDGVSSGRFDNASEIAEFRRKIDPETSLSNSVLLARVIQDLRQPEGYVIVTSQVDMDQSSPLATFVGFQIKPLSPEVTIPVKDLIGCGILLNDKAMSRLERHNNETIISPADLFSIFSSSVKAQSYLEVARKNGRMKELMHRFEYAQAVKELK